MSAAATDFRAAVDICTRFFVSIDDRDWARFEGCLAPTVVTDFTKLWGGAPERNSAADLTSNWSHLFAGFVATQHLVSGYAASNMLTDHKLTLRAMFQTTHHGDDPFGSATWTLYGTYQIGFERIGDHADLRIAGIYQTPTFGVGNRNIVLRALAATRG